MIWRVYFNRRGDEPWSVDDGSQETERTCDGVVLCGCFWRTQTVPDRAMIDPELTPVAWIEVEASDAPMVGGKIVFVP